MRVSYPASYSMVQANRITQYTQYALDQSRVDRDSDLSCVHILFFLLSRGDVAARFEQPPLIEPLDPLQGR